MKKTFKQIYGFVMTALTTLFLTAVPAFAANPATGDERGRMMGIFLVLLVVSIVVIILYVALGSKKKKGTGKDKKNK